MKSVSAAICPIELVVNRTTIDKRAGYQTGQPRNAPGDGVTVGGDIIPRSVRVFHALLTVAPAIAAILEAQTGRHAVR